MKKIIHNLRQKPEEVRRHILHIVIFIIAVVLFVAWIYTLGTDLSDEETKAVIKNNLQPLSALKDNLTGGYINLQNFNEAE